MYSSIRIGLFALLVQFLFVQNLIFAQTRPEPLPPLDSLSWIELLSMDSSLFQKAQYLSNLSFSRVVMEEENNAAVNRHFEVAQKDSTSAKALLDSLSIALKQANTRYKKAIKLSERAKKAEQLTADMTTMDSLSLRKNLPKAWKLVTQVFDEIHPPLISETTDKEPEAVKKTKPVVEKVKSSAPSYTKKYDPSADVMLSPPTPPCSVASSSRDEFSGEVSRELSGSELFRFTNPALKKYLSGKAHVVCEAALASAGPNAVLLLTFHINDPNARKAFGRLEKNSIASIRFLDGQTLELRNSVGDDGVFAEDNEASIFRGQYPLTPEVFKKLRKSELDTIRILWSKGYDDYEVQQVDLLMRQAECLFK